MKTAETIWSAQQKCPHLLLTLPRQKDYEKYCGVLNNIYGRYTDMIELGGLDESYLDVTGSLHMFGASPIVKKSSKKDRFLGTSL